MNGCVYCNNKAFSVYAGKRLDIKDQIIQSIEYYKKKMGVNRFIAYFQSFTNTYGEIDTLRRTYEVIREFPQIVGLFVSTRPDCIDEEKIKLISEYKKEYLVWIEYGLQTTQDKVLALINRNHSYQDFLNAYTLTKKYDINIGAHIIIGLPTQSYEDILSDAEQLSRLDIDGVKFHILHVLKNTELEVWHREGRVKLLNKDEYVRIICDFLERIPPRFVILRLVSSANPVYLVAPQWINKRAEVVEDIKRELERRNTYQGYLYEGNGSI
jgi:hypothetical protein